LAVANGYKNVYWMRDGVKGWMEAGYPTESEAELLKQLMAVNKTDFAALRISEQEARKLKNCNFVDFRAKAKFEAKHVQDAKHVEHGDMFSKPMMELLNKSNNIVVIHDDPATAGSIAMTLKMMAYPKVYILK
jgi:rhodanese-related sulfurtransferase